MIRQDVIRDSVKRNFYSNRKIKGWGMVFLSLGTFNSWLDSCLKKYFKLELDKGDS